MKKYSVRINMVVILSVITMLSSSNTLRAGSEVKTVAIFPFEVMAKGDVGFIGKGMGKMLCSRIATDSNIVVKSLDRLPSEYGLDLSGLSTVEKIAGIAELNGVDFILTGTVTIAGESVSSDARLMEVLRPEQVKYINSTGTGVGDIMNHASAISEKVKAIISGHPLDSVAKANKNSGPYLSSTAGSQQVINSFGNGAAKSGAVVPVYPMAEGSKKTLQTAPLQHGATMLQQGVIMPPSDSPVLMNRKLDMEILGVATADIDGDGMADLVVIDPHNLYFFTFSNNNITKKGEYKGEYYNRNIAVDAIDSNNDGRSELFITSLGKNNYLKSYVLKWNGRELEPVLKDAEWYFRVVNYDGKLQLLGQKRGHDEAFTGSIFSLDVSGKSIVKRQSIASEDFEIFGFSPVKSALDSNMNSNSRYFTWFDRAGFLILGDDGGAREWKSPHSLGSTSLFVELDRGRDQLKERVYINSRVVVTDMNRDSVDEIVTVKNSDIAKGYLAGYRKFTQGHIEVMGWKDGSMADLWSGNPATGYISDFTLMDMDGDSYPELIYSVVTESGLVMDKINSTVFIQKIVEYQK